MHYDPIKDIFADLINRLPLTRIFFYKLLDTLFLRSWYVRRELRNLRRLLGSERIIVYDAGTGYGQYAYFISRRLLPVDVYAVDIKRKWTEDCSEFFSARGIRNVKFSVEDLTAIDHDSIFDIIVCVDVMEHIEEDVKVFQNFYKALKPGGYLLINTPSIYGGSDVHGKDEESFIGEHAREGYSKEQLEEKLHPLGFVTHKSVYTYGFWGDKAWRLGIKFPMFLLDTSKLFLLLLPVYYILTFPLTLFMMFLDYSSENKIGSGINFIAKKR